MTNNNKVLTAHQTKRMLTVSRDLLIALSLKEVNASCTNGMNTVRDSCFHVCGESEQIKCKNKELKPMMDNKCRAEEN